VKTVLIPEDNVKDLQDIPENAKNQLEIVPVRWIDKVLEVALESMPKPLADDDLAVKTEPVAAASSAVVEATAGDGLPH
jgi:ATP-dependent Lon protease